jgi:Rrf2 family protein
MKISTRGRYALRVIIDLAEHSGGDYIALKEIAERQDISLKYLEGIMTSLSKSGLIDGAHGKGGGYRLNRAPDEYSVWDILCVTEGDMAPVACLGSNAEPCPVSSTCRTVKMWKDFEQHIKEYFSNIKISDLMDADSVIDYVI